MTAALVALNQRWAMGTAKALAAQLPRAVRFVRS
jgi:hypothetical protein